ncbi:MAG: hypothetical protein AAB558_01060, partial [Patescibacteria group bacterium]
ARNRNTVAQDGLRQQTAFHLEKVRKYAIGPEREKLSPGTARRLTGEYMMRANQLEEALLEAAVEESPVTGKLATLKEAFMPIPRNKLVEFQSRVSRQLSRLHGIDEARGEVTDPALTIFFYAAAMKYLSIPNFNGDEWYGEVMSQRAPLLRKLALPLVAHDMLERAAQERARPMPNSEVLDSHHHRAVNALAELIEVWGKDMPAVADKYQAVKDTLDQALRSLTEYYRQETRLH